MPSSGLVPTGVLGPAQVDLERASRQVFGCRRLKTRSGACCNGNTRGTGMQHGEPHVGRAVCQLLGRGGPHFGARHAEFQTLRNALGARES